MTLDISVLLSHWKCPGSYFLMMQCHFEASFFPGHPLLHSGLQAMALAHGNACVHRRALNFMVGISSSSIGDDAPPGRVEAAQGQLRQLAAALRCAVPMRYTNQAIWAHLQSKRCNVPSGFEAALLDFVCAYTPLTVQEMATNIHAMLM